MTNYNSDDITLLLTKVQSIKYFQKKNLAIIIDSQVYHISFTEIYFPKKSNFTPALIRTL